MEEFKLGSIVRKVLDETSETDVHKVSAEILNLIPEEHYREVILNLLPSYVRVAYGVQRNNTTAEWADDVVAPEPPRQREYAPKTYGSGQYLSRKVEEAWVRKLRDRIHVAEGGYKFLKDCNFDDLIFAAEERMDKARKLEATSRVYEVFAKTVRSHGVEVFGDLPRSVQKDLLTKNELD